ncbi:MAG TPA: S-layer homology domain-containing protein, partial [Candidatus Paenibacillus intestinavium]|nr:S-layer homology domain-containing protein [Candidatus Paenibacillus intestinavium]
MLPSNNRTKYLTMLLVLLLFSTILSPFTVGAESSQSQISQAGPATSGEPINHQRYSDVPDTAWYAEAVNTWIQLGILNPKEDDKLNPQLVMTRGEFAKYLAISVGLSPSKSTLPFKDMSVNDVSTGYI